MSSYRGYVAAILLMCTLILGVGTGGPQTGTARAAGKTTVTVWLPDYCSPTTQNWFKNTFEPAFAKKYPQLSVHMVYVDWSVYDQKIATAFAGGTAPDVIETGASYVPDLVIKHQIRSIDPYLPAWGHKKDFYPGAWANTVWEGHNYGVPYLSGVRGLVYRKSMLKAAGIARPPQTWDELYADAIKLTKRDAKGTITQLGFATSPGSPVVYFQQWLAYLEEAGGTVATPDGRKATINNQAGIATTAFFAKLFQAMTPGGVGLSNKLVAPFESGKVAMQISDASISGEVLRYNPKILNDVGVAVPMVGPGPHGKRVSVAYNDWLAITTQSKNPDAAWQWLSFATQPDYLGGYDRTCGEIPTNKIAVQAPWVTSNPIHKQFTENVFPYAVAHPVFPNIVQMWNIVGTEVEKTAYNKESPAEAMKRAEDASNAVLAGTATH